MVLPVNMCNGPGVLEQLNCGFTNADCGIRKKSSIWTLRITIRNPRSPIRNVTTPAAHRYYFRLQNDMLSSKKKAFLLGDIRVKGVTMKKKQPHQPGGAADGGWKRELRQEVNRHLISLANMAEQWICQHDQSDNYYIIQLVTFRNKTRPRLIITSVG